MSEKRKRIFRESIFLIPFLLIVTVVSLGCLFKIGRTVKDTVMFVEEHLSADNSMDISVYAEGRDRYTLKYYYGDNDSCTKFAEYSMKSGDEPVYELTLLEDRDGFEAGFYKTEWFHSAEYVTYAPIDDEKNTESYTVEEQPYIYEYIKSYSYDSLMSNHGALTEYSDGYSVFGIFNMYVWDSENGVNCIWGVGKRAVQFYTCPNSGGTEYKKVTIS